MDNWKEILLGPLKDSKLKEHSFVTKVYESQITFDYKKLMSLLDNESMEKFPYMKTTYFKEKNILLREEFKFLLNSCQQFYKEVAQQNNYTSWNIITSWVQRYDTGDFHDTHIHFPLENHWNFIFYLDCKENSSNMVVLEPGYPYVNDNKRITIKPKIGGCVAFPGHIPHFVEPNKTDKRIILSSILEYLKGGKNV